MQEPLAVSQTKSLAQQSSGNSALQKRQAPLSGVDGKPMRRASLAQLRALLADEEIAGYEASP